MYLLVPHCYLGCYISDIYMILRTDLLGGLQEVFTYKRAACQCIDEVCTYLGYNLDK